MGRQRTPETGPEITVGRAEVGPGSGPREASQWLGGLRRCMARKLKVQLAGS